MRHAHAHGQRRRTTVGTRRSLKNSGSHIDASHSRQPLVKGERLVRYEVNAVMLNSATAGTSHASLRCSCCVEPFCEAHCILVETAIEILLRLQEAAKALVPRRSTAPATQINQTHIIIHLGWPSSNDCYPKGCAAPGFVPCRCNTRGPLSKLERTPPQRKINVTSKSPVGDISVVTLIRTDTTLDHSQKAEKV